MKRLTGAASKFGAFHVWKFGSLPVSHVVTGMARSQTEDGVCGLNSVSHKVSWGEGERSLQLSTLHAFLMLCVPQHTQSELLIASLSDCGSNPPIFAAIVIPNIGSVIPCHEVLSVTSGKPFFQKITLRLTVKAIFPVNLTSITRRIVAIVLLSPAHQASQKKI